MSVRMVLLMPPTRAVAVATTAVPAGAAWVGEAAAALGVGAAADGVGYREVPELVDELPQAASTSGAIVRAHVMVSDRIFVIIGTLSSEGKCLE